MNITLFEKFDEVNDIYIKEKAAKLIKINADLYLTNGLYDKALSYYIELFDLKDYYEECDDSIKENIRTYIRDSIFGIIAIKVKQKEYNGLKELIIDNIEYLTAKEYYRINKYIDINMNIKVKDDSYKEVAFHIIKGHQMDFYNNMDIEILLDNVLENVDSEELCNGFSFKYYVSFDNPIGDVCDTETNCIEVVAFLDKTNIITMYPYLWNKEAINIDLNQKVKKYG